jgi:serine/threonine protein kinase/tetratricopeptide (TPR) repeat protein
MRAEPGNKEASAADDDLVMSLVEKALQQAGEDREGFLRKACGGDGDLFETVRHYVAWDERMKGFLLNPLCTLLAEESELEPGQMLENRFRIVRKLAAGGMGVVYEAQDEKLARRIAIKCAKAGFNARLPPEVRHASEINHPNVCKTWEIHTASGPRGSFDFFTMEFIDGQTLAERLRDGPLPDKEARNIATQLCAGLAEAHRHQVIHGDLKSNNILLARATGGTRVVITDFGLARPGLTQDPGVMSGDVGGTPDYMAPELLKRERPSVASDIYALGVILHEIAAGRTPFDGTVPLQERAVRRPAQLKHPWGRVVARCLDPNPARRYPDVAELATALVPFPLRRWSAIVAALAIAAVAGAIGYRTVGVSREVVRLAVLPFATNKDSKSLSDGLLQDTADRLRRVRNDRRKLTIIPMRDALQNKVDAPEKAAALLGATHILTGSLRRDDDRISVRAFLTDARSRLQLKEWDAEYQPNELRNMPVALAGLVTGTLDLPPLVTTATVNAAAYPDFAAGTGLFERDSVDAAIPLLARAVMADPNSPLTYARLAEAQARKYNLSLASSWLDQARTNLHEAQERNPDLALVWVVSGRLKEYQGLYEAAESDLKRALEIDPRDGDAWRRLGMVYKKNNRFGESVVSYQRAIETQPDYFMNYLDLCAVHLQQANYGEAVQQCRKLVQLAPDLSDGHFALALPLFCRGNYAEADAEFLRAIQLNPMSANAIFSRAFALTSEGRSIEAIPLFHRAIEIGRATHLMYSDLGTAYRLAGFPAAAKKAYSSGLELAEKDLEKNPRDAVLKAQLAYLCARLGERSRANSEAIQARQLAPDSVDVAWWLVQTWGALGQQDEAFDVLQHFPDDALGRLNRDADLADFRRSSRFQQLMTLRHIQ